MKNSKENYRESEEHYCENCGAPIRDTNDTGGLCERCYMREYYDGEDYW